MPAQFESLIGKAIYQATHWSAFGAYTFCWSGRAMGRENMPKSGPVLVVANHQSFFDPVLVGLCGSRPLTYLARHGLFKNRYMAKLIRFYGAVPVNQSVGKDGLNAVFSALERKEAVLVFPEGSRTPDGQIHPMMAGISLIIKKADCLVLPVGIAGAFDAWPIHNKLPKLNPLFMGDQGMSIALAYGQPVHSSELRNLDRENMLSSIEQKIRTCYEQAEKLRRRP